MYKEEKYLDIARKGSLSGGGNLNTKDRIKLLLDYVNLSLDFLYYNDGKLIYNPLKNNEYRLDTDGQHASEQSIQYQLAYYLESLLRMNSKFNQYSVDCEYNRYEDQIKK